jgi:hypothetical protein
VWKYEYWKNIIIHFWNSSNLIVLSSDSCSKSGFVPARIRKCNVCLSLAFPWKQISFQAIQKCRCFMFIPHLPFYSCSLLIRRFRTSNIDRKQSHYSDGSNLNSGCIVFVFLQNKHLNYTVHEACSNIYKISFPRKFLCGRIVEYINLYVYYSRLQLLIKTAIKLPLFKETRENYLCCIWTLPVMWISTGIRVGSLTNKH